MKNRYWLRKQTAAVLSVGLLLLPIARAEEDPIAWTVSSMTLREKVGQLFMVRPDALEGRFSAAELEDNSIVGSTEVTETMRAAYAQYPCGGFALFRKNILSPEQLKAFAESLHVLGAYTPMLGIDEEGGSIARIANHPAGFPVPKFPAMSAIAQRGDQSQAYALGQGIGAYLAKYGLDIDFAPVADVNTNPNNPVIGSRAFGDDPIRAAGMVRQVISGLHEIRNQ